MTHDLLVALVSASAACASALVVYAYLLHRSWQRERALERQVAAALKAGYEAVEGWRNEAIIWDFPIATAEAYYNPHSRRA